LEVVLGDGGLPNGPGTQVHDVVTVVPDLGEQLRHPALGPVTAYPKEIRINSHGLSHKIDLVPPEI
jgi:hypothetical protein